MSSVILCSILCLLALASSLPVEDASSRSSDLDSSLPVEDASSRSSDQDSSRSVQDASPTPVDDLEERKILSTDNLPEDFDLVNATVSIGIVTDASTPEQAKEYCEKLGTAVARSQKKGKDSIVDPQNFQTAVFEDDDTKVIAGDYVELDERQKFRVVIVDSDDASWCSVQTVQEKLNSSIPEPQGDKMYCCCISLFVKDDGEEPHAEGADVPEPTESVKAPTA